MQFTQEKQAKCLTEQEKWHSIPDQYSIFRCESTPLIRYMIEKMIVDAINTQNKQ